MGVNGYEFYIRGSMKEQDYQRPFMCGNCFTSPL